MKIKRFKKCLSLLLALILFISFIPISAKAETAKEQIYVQYVQITKEISDLTNKEINVLPIEELKEEDWVSVEEFRERVLDFAELSSNAKISFNLKDNYSENYFFNTYAYPISCTGYYKFSTSNISSEVAITASFTTKYNGIRQMIGAVDSISSEISRSNVGKWSQIGSSVEILDGGRTAKVNVSGAFEYLGLVTNLYAYSYFRCSANGGITPAEY